jgi:hypothetical protein
MMLDGWNEKEKTEEGRNDQLISVAPYLYKHQVLIATNLTSCITPLITG